MNDETLFLELKNYLSRIPSIANGISTGLLDDGCWWVKFSIDISHPFAWNVVQELGHVLNYISLEERLPTVFMPVSPPPYINGGPKEFLSWIIESKRIDFTPDECARWLEGRLPRPVEDIKRWTND